MCSNSDDTCVNEGFSAHSGPLGENPQGHISATFSAGKLRGDVVCLQVVGNQAYILAKETRSDDAIPQGQQFLLNVVDNGNPVDGTPVDLIRNSFVGSFTAPTTANPCGLPTLPGALDADHAGRQIHACLAKGHQFAAAKSLRTTTAAANRLGSRGKSRS